jgi:hypothetical protein
VRIDIPQNTRRVTRRRDDFLLTQETAAGKKTVMRGHFGSLTDIIAGENRTKIIESSAGYQIASSLLDTNRHDVGRLETN